MEMKWEELSPIAVSQSNYYGVLKTVYYPGLVCSNWRRHADRAAEITHGFIMGDGRILGPDCLKFELAQPIVTTAVDNKHWMPRHWDLETQKSWKDLANKKYWKMIQLCGLISQIMILIDVPGKRGSYFDFDVMLKTRETDLTYNQKAKLYTYIRTWYKFSEPDKWSVELDESIKLLTQWRNDAFKVTMMQKVIAPHNHRDPQFESGDNFITMLVTEDILASFKKQLGYKPLTEKQQKLLLVIERDRFNDRCGFTKYQCDLITDNRPMIVNRQ